MSQVNVNPGGYDRERIVEERRGAGAGTIAAIIIGVVLLILLAWWAFGSNMFGNRTTVVQTPGQTVERSTDRTVIQQVPSGAVQPGAQNGVQPQGQVNAQRPANGATTGTNSTLGGASNGSLGASQPVR